MSCSYFRQNLWVAVTLAWSAAAGCLSGCAAAADPSVTKLTVDGGAAEDAEVAAGSPDGAAGADSPPPGSGDAAAAPDSAQDGGQAAADASSCQITPHLSSIQKHVFSVQCATPSCHGASNPAGSLDLRAGKSWLELVNNPAASVGAPGWQRVAPAKPDDSFLLIKVTEPLPGQGKLMPLGAPEPLDKECAVEAIRQWIAAGALDD